MQILRVIRNTGLLAVAVLLAAWPAASQMGMGTPPPDFRGVFSPVIGAGAAYEVEGRNGKNEIEVAIIGKEDVNGKAGYWVEMTMGSAKAQTLTKSLMVIDGANTTIARLIIQQAGQEPMDMSGMMGMMNQNKPPTPTDSRALAKRIGAESVTTPAGTFDTEHYRANDGSWDAWLSTKVAPWGLIKSTGKESSMMLTRVISNATDRITGTPKKMDMQEMMRGMGQVPRR